MKYLCLLSLIMFHAPLTGCAPKPMVDTLASNHVKQAFSGVVGDIQECHDKHRQAGLLDIRFTVAGQTGRVVDAVVVGDFADSLLGKCVQAIVVNMEFPRFEKPYARLNYAIVLN